jgi:phage gpG-like protein
MRWDWSKLQPFVVAVKTACGSGIMASGKVIQNDIRVHFPRTGRYKSSPPGSPPNMRRESLRNSIKLEQAGPLEARVGSNIKYAHVHEFGKHIAARDKWLTVPINEAAARLSEQGIGLRTAPGGVRFFRSKALNLIAIGGEKTKAPQRIKGADGKPRQRSPKGFPMWVLKETVSIPARPFMRPGLKRAKTNPQVFAGFARGVNTALKAAGFKTKVVRA